jgi:hypothetical protein
MPYVDALITTTLPLRHPNSGRWYLSIPLEIRNKLGLMEGSLLEIAIIRALPPPVKPEGKDE